MIAFYARICTSFVWPEEDDGGKVKHCGGESTWILDMAGNYRICDLCTNIIMILSNNPRYCLYYDLTVLTSYSNRPM